MFEITEQGRAKVRTPEFCDELEAFVVQGMRDGMDETFTQHWARFVCLNSPCGPRLQKLDLDNLSELEASEMELFMLKNRDEINEAIDYCESVSLVRLNERKALREKARQLWPTLKK